MLDFTEAQALIKIGQTVIENIYILGRWRACNCSPEDSLTSRPKAGIVKSEETSIPWQLFGKNIPAATNTHAIIEQPVSKERIGKHTAIGVLFETVFSVRSVKVVIKESSVERVAG
jgi:hypothetical protein